MNARRSILVVSAVALVSASSLFSMNHHQQTMTIVPTVQAPCHMQSLGAGFSLVINML